MTACTVIVMIFDGFKNINQIVNKFVVFLILSRTHAGLSGYRI